MPRKELRPYQAENKAGVYDAWGRLVSAGKPRNVIAVIPTGGGKSVEVSDIVWDFDQQGSYTATIAHRQELVGQLSTHLADFGIKHRIIAPRDVVSGIVAQHREEFGRSYVEPNALAAVVGVDTLVARADDLRNWAMQVGLWTIDEAHHVLTDNKWGQATTMFPNAFGLGVTATPQRADGNGLGTRELGGNGVFSEMIIGPSMRQLIDMGSLTEYEIVIPESDFNTGALAVTGGGDFSPKAMRDASKNSKIVGDVVEQYLTHAFGKLGVTFATDVEAATKMAERFNLFGVPAAVVTGKTHPTIRNDLIRRFRRGEIWMLVNVDLFGEGFDLPAIEVVIMARPTLSLAVFLQQLGRSLRPMPGKTRGLIIDLVSNFKIHGLPDRPRVWTLSSRDRRRKTALDPDDIPVKKCVKCTRGYSGVLRVCPYCGHEPVPMGGGRSVEQVDGDLMLLDAAMLAEMRKAVVLDSPDAIGHKVFNATNAGFAIHAMDKQRERIVSQQQLAETIALWAGHERAKGRADSESYRRFYFATKGIDVAAALTLPRVEMDALRETVQGWIKI
jgi:DNA repair protein RadD